jgi:hypothetical protein
MESGNFKNSFSTADLCYSLKLLLYFTLLCFLLYWCMIDYNQGRGVTLSRGEIAYSTHSDFYVPYLRP